MNHYHDERQRNLKEVNQILSEILKKRFGRTQGKRILKALVEKKMN